MEEVIVVKTGVANTASVLAGLQRAGASARLSVSAKEVAEAQAVLLPGVGAFGAGMQQLVQTELCDVIKQRITQGKATMAICVGMQLLFSQSEESPGVEGLGIFPEAIHRFSGEVRVPQLGWNYVEASESCSLLESGYAYFANSYRASEVPSSCEAAHAEHGGRFVAAIERGALLATQFHPELSGAWGQELLSRWLSRAERGV